MIRSSCPDGRKLATLRDAGNYISALPQRQHDAPEWQVAVEVLMQVVEENGPTMMARIGIMRALNAGQAKHREPRRKALKRYRVVR